MNRATPELSKPDDVSRTATKLASVPRVANPLLARNVGLFRLFLLVFASAAGVSFAPFGLHGWSAALLGAAVALAVLLTETLLRAASTASLIGGALGALAGSLLALLISLIIFRTSLNESTRSFFSVAALLACGYLGVTIGSRRAHLLRLEPLLGVVRPGAPSSRAEAKLLDTSVLIDGRIADICEAHFLDGPLLVPQFVLHELQMIADSADSLRRQRGRRGLDVLDRIRKMPHLEVRVIDDNPGSSGEVDRKLIDLAQRLHAKIVTNDFNLNKVASVQGISVLNINLLANALRPAVLPGEGMRVFILREGKEANQGVAYLEDGTMVVVDGARRLINKTVDILVTSVHQTPAGKMIFGRLDERNDAMPNVRQAAVGGRAPRPAIPDSGE
jgi:uncharacterized protein YacL